MKKYIVFIIIVIFTTFSTCITYQKEYRYFVIKSKSSEYQAKLPIYEPEYKERVNYKSLFDNNNKKYVVIIEQNSKLKLYTSDKIIDAFKADYRYEYITSFNFSEDKSFLIVSTDKNIYISRFEKNNLKFQESDFKWIKLKRKGLRYYDYITSAAIIKKDNLLFIFVGTSFNGLYYKILPQNFKEDNKNFKHLHLTKIVSYTYKKSRYFETINYLYSSGNSLFVGYAFGKGIDRIDIMSEISNNNKNIYYYFSKTSCPIPISFEKNESIKKIFKENGRLYAITNFTTYFYNSTKNSWEPIVKENKIQRKYNIKDDFLKGLYYPVYKLKTRKEIDNLIKLLKFLKLNTLVIDLKDDYGNLTYFSNIEFAYKINAVKPKVDLSYLIEKAHKNGIYVIARLVTFKDMKLFNYANGKYAFKDKITGKPWIGTRIERWVDPACEEVQEYIIKILKEIQNLGVDEIQFDYIRYPSDGKIGNIISKYNKKGFSKYYIFSKFFEKVKKVVKIPISVDYYGFQGFYIISRFIGQDLFYLSKYFDVVYPMYYPSHFPNGFYQLGLTREQTNFFIYRDGVYRAFQNGNYKIKVRPWVQAFKWKVKTNYIKYIQSQIDGIKAAGINSFMFWNQSGHYKELKDVKY